MENQETITTLKGIQEKESKAGRKYFSVETDKGSMTCFEKDITDELSKRIGKQVRIEVAENDKGFKNIRKFLGEITTEKVSGSQKAEQPQTSNEDIAEARKAKDICVYTSYAKDIFVKLTDKTVADAKPSEIMAVAVELVKQARDSFSK